MMADADDDDEDDANPAQTPASRMNPLQLLNQALEHGARSTVRQYRKNMAAYQQQSMMDPGIELRPLLHHQASDAMVPSRHASVVEEIVVHQTDVRKPSRAAEKESFWSRFKASCLICHMFFLSTIDRTIRLLNGVTREHRRVRRTIDLEKRMVKRRVLAIVEKSPEDTQ
ncbi:unnamed protein product [Dibothriocephalus latus]|uniref:Uncharacterized protein n=1 Tax=Dibothriocephalus latus TaxID=60516 RepID=A0A3P7PFW9_DIBLA|nr:unnamed protein product [Dibothriocephalus latus]